MNKYGLKGNAPEELSGVLQLIAFLYVGVAYLNDANLSNNELDRMVEILKKYGYKDEDSIKLIQETVSWFDDSLKKDVWQDNIIQCVKLLKNSKGWDEELKDTIHTDLYSINTADGLIDLKGDKFTGEKQLKVVNTIMELF
ncbi:MAG: hypothetical protein CMG46_01390 [Candidatus Marinimicrobia bacterium]|nr:hypothetical protein [Candidatus Neomarinimicrobiota bacterium]